MAFYGTVYNTSIAPPLYRITGIFTVLNCTKTITPGVGLDAKEAIKLIG